MTIKDDDDEKDDNDGDKGGDNGKGYGDDSDVLVVVFPLAVIATNLHLAAH